MEIKYQAILKNNLIIKPAGAMADDSGFLFTVKPLTIDEIVNLESIYNSESLFPSSLRELLFLAGKRCYVLDYGLNDTQEEMQDEVRDCLVEYGFNNLIFVYLDEGVNDPIVYQANLDPYLSSGYPRIMSLKASLSAFVNNRISELLNGYNPF